MNLSVGGGIGGSLILVGIVAGIVWYKIKRR